MIFLRMDKRGQSLTEYAILFSVVAAAYLGMQLYVKRGVQAKIKGVSDYLAQAGGKQVKQYEPYYTAVSDYTVTQERAADVEVKDGFAVEKSGIKESTKRAATGSESQGSDLKIDDDWK